MHSMMKARVAAVLVGGLLAASLATAAPKIPRLKSGKPDFSGIWETTSAAGLRPGAAFGRADAPPSAGVIEGKTIPYLPAALEQKKKKLRCSRHRRSALEVLDARHAARHLLPRAVPDLPARSRSDLAVPVRPFGAHHSHERHVASRKSRTTSFISAIRAAIGKATRWSST